MRESGTQGSEILRRLAQLLFLGVIFSFPFEHKYDKWFRHFSRTLLPEGIQLPPNFNQKIYFYLSDFAALCLFIAALFLFRLPIRRFFTEKGALYLWALFACAILSILSSPLATYPVVYTRLLQLATPFFLFSFLVHCFPNREKAIFTALWLAALFQTAVAITQYFVQSPLGLHLLSEPKLPTGTFGNPDGCRWLFDRLMHRKASEEILRATGTLPHCNVLGGFLVFSLLASYSLIVTESRRWFRWLIGLTLTFQFFTLSITYSRSALFGWGLGTVIWFGYLAYHRGLRQVVMDVRVRFLAGVIFLSVAISGVLLFEQYIYRGGVVNYNKVAKGSDRIRIDAQNTAFQIIEDHPFLGVGYQQFSRGAASYFPNEAKKTGAHNIYLFLAGEMGLISLAIFVGFIATILLASLRAPFSPYMASSLSVFIAFLFIGMCDFYLILFQQGKLMLFFAAGLLAAQEPVRIKVIDTKKHFE